MEDHGGKGAQAGTWEPSEAAGDTPGSREEAPTPPHPLNPTRNYQDARNKRFQVQWSHSLQIQKAVTIQLNTEARVQSHGGLRRRIKS